MRKLRVALVQLPTLLRDILTAALRDHAGMEVSYVDRQLYLLDREIFEISDLIITAAEHEKLMVCLNELLVVNPRLVIINLCDDGKTGRLLRFQMMEESLGEIFLEKILQVVRRSIVIPN